MESTALKLVEMAAGHLEVMELLEMPRVEEAVDSPAYSMEFLMLEASQ